MKIHSRPAVAAVVAAAEIVVAAAHAAGAAGAELVGDFAAVRAACAQLADGARWSGLDVAAFAVAAVAAAAVEVARAGIQVLANKDVDDPGLGGLRQMRQN